MALCFLMLKSKCKAFNTQIPVNLLLLYLSYALCFKPKEGYTAAEGP